MLRQKVRRLLFIGAIGKVRGRLIEGNAEHWKIFLNSQVLFFVIRSSLFANWHSLKLVYYPKRNWEEGTLSSQMITFGRDGFQICEKDIPGSQNC
jgi:hypothetical protein